MSTRPCFIVILSFPFPRHQVNVAFTVVVPVRSLFTQPAFVMGSLTYAAQLGLGSAGVPLPSWVTFSSAIDSSGANRYNVVYFGKCFHGELFWHYILQSFLQLCFDTIFYNLFYSYVLTGTPTPGQSLKVCSGISGHIIYLPLYYIHFLGISEHSLFKYFSITELSNRNISAESVWSVCLC